MLSSAKGASQKLIIQVSEINIQPDWNKVLVMIIESS